MAASLQYVDTLLLLAFRSWLPSPICNFCQVSLNISIFTIQHCDDKLDDTFPACDNYEVLLLHIHCNNMIDGNFDCKAENEWHHGMQWHGKLLAVGHKQSAIEREYLQN